MRAAHALLIPLLALAPALTACGGSAEPTWADTAEAMDAGQMAAAAGDVETAIAAFQQAAQDPDPATRAVALTSLFEVATANGRLEVAREALTALQALGPQVVTVEALDALSAAVVATRDADLVEEFVQVALEMHPDAQDVFANELSVAEKLRLEGPDADLSSLGYAGD